MERLYHEAGTSLARLASSFCGQLEICMHRYTLVYVLCMSWSHVYEDMHAGHGDIFKELPHSLEAVTFDKGANPPRANVSDVTKVPF